MKRDRAEPLFSIMNEDGSCADEHRSLVGDEDLLRVLETMVMNRVMDRRLLNLQRQGRLGFYMTSTGEEATTIGTAMCLEDGDPIFMAYRELGALLWRRIPIAMLLNQMIGNSQDPMHGRQMPLHYCFPDWNIPSVSSPVGTQLPHACGYAYASKLRGTGQVSLAFCGEGTASEGDFHTALNFAGVFGVPAVYVIRNNGYAISTPESVQTAAESLAVRAEGYGFPGHQVDGNDLLAVVNVMRQAVDRARRGEGPTLVEAMTYRMGAHSTADDPSAYRAEEERERWRQLDPFERTKRHARWRGLFSEEEEQGLEQAWDARLVDTIAECERHPPPPLETLFEDVQQKIGPQLAAQREAYFAFRKAQARKETSELP